MSKPSVNPLVNLPTERAARFRLYDIVTKCNPVHGCPVLRNKEQIKFRASADDIMYIGGFTRTTYVNMTQLTDVLTKLDGFFWVRFRKKDDTIRDMYAVKMHGRIAGNMSLRDLSLPNSETRQCIIGNIIDLVAHSTHYIHGRDPTARNARNVANKKVKGSPVKKMITTIAKKKRKVKGW